jgi:hypothetical protein
MLRGMWRGVNFRRQPRGGAHDVHRQHWNSADAAQALIAARDWLRGLSNETVGWLAIGTVVAIGATLAVAV